MTRLTRQSLAMSILAVGLTGAARAQEPVAISLGGAARLAAERNASPQIARLKVDQAEARVRQSRAEFLPTVTAAALDNERTFNSASFGINFANPLTGKYTFDPDGEVLGPVKTWDFRGTLKQNIFDPGSFARLRAARANVTASAVEVSSAAQTVAADAALKYVLALRADAQYLARMDDSTLAAELLGIARDQLSAGVGIALDVTRAQSQLSMVRSQLIAAFMDRERARLNLVRAIGLPVDTRVTLTDSLTTLPSAPTLPTEADAVQRASHTRADLKALDEQAAAAQLALGAIRADALPTLALFADEGATGKSTQHLLNTYTWGIQLSVPVFDGLRRNGRAAEQRSAVNEIAVRRKDLLEQATADVRAALGDLRTAREQLTASQERVGFAEQDVAQARDRFRAGVSGNADVITALMTLNGARTQLIDARTSLQISRILLARAQGTVTDLP